MALNNSSSDQTSMRQLGVIVLEKEASKEHLYSDHSEQEDETG
jgi:hypothetical protein